MLRQALALMCALIGLAVTPALAQTELTESYTSAAGFTVSYPDDYLLAVNADDGSIQLMHQTTLNTIVLQTTAIMVSTGALDENSAQSIDTLIAFYTADGVIQSEQTELTINGQRAVLVEIAQAESAFLLFHVTTDQLAVIIVPVLDDVTNVDVLSAIAESMTLDGAQTDVPDSTTDPSGNRFGAYTSQAGYTVSYPEDYRVSDMYNGTGGIEMINAVMESRFLLETVDQAAANGTIAAEAAASLESVVEYLTFDDAFPYERVDVMINDRPAVLLDYETAQSYLVFALPSGDVMILGNFEAQQPHDRELLIAIAESVTFDDGAPDSGAFVSTSELPHVAAPIPPSEMPDGIIVLPASYGFTLYLDALEWMTFADDTPIIDYALLQSVEETRLVLITSIYAGGTDLLRDGFFVDGLPSIVDVTGDALTAADIITTANGYTAYIIEQTPLVERRESVGVVALVEIVADVHYAVISVQDTEAPDDDALLDDVRALVESISVAFAPDAEALVTVPEATDTDDNPSVDVSGGGVYDETLTCYNVAYEFVSNNYTTMTVTCPPGCDQNTSGTVWGTDVYTDDSSVCAAAVHSGLITVAEGGTVTITYAPGQDSYTGSERGTITTYDYGPWGGSFTLSEPNE